VTITMPTRDYLPLAIPAAHHRAERINVRSAELNDSAALHRLFTEPHIVRGTSASPLARSDETHAWLETALASGHLLVALAGDELIGSLLLSPQRMVGMRHSAQISRVAVSAAWQGRGVASRLLAEALSLADNWMGLLRLELLVLAENMAARKVYARYGFREEGRLHAYVLRDSVYHDVIAMARLRGPMAGER
jgi:L-phenylalanine/L-methionine N-acetyltransferase